MFEKPRVNCQVTSKLKQDLKNTSHLQAHSQSHINSHLLLTPGRRDLGIWKFRVTWEVSKTHNKGFKESLILENWITQALLCWNITFATPDHFVGRLVVKLHKKHLLLVLALLLAAYSAAGCLRIRRRLWQFSRSVTPCHGLHPPIHPHRNSIMDLLK